MACHVQRRKPYADGGGRGIRTPGTVSRSVVFKTTAIDHSAIPPRQKSCQNSRDFGARGFASECWSQSLHFGPNRREVLWARAFGLTQCHCKCHCHRPAAPSPFVAIVSLGVI